MTIIVGYRHKNRFLLAADSQSTFGDGTIANHTSNKIERWHNFVIAGSGATVAMIALKKILWNMNDDDIQLDVQLCGVVTGLMPEKDGEEDCHGSALLLRLNDDDKIIDVLVVHINDTLLIENLLAENQRLVTLGSGGTLFRGAFAGIQKQRGFTDYEGTKGYVKRAMDIVAEQSAYCNNRYMTEAYDIYV